MLVYLFICVFGISYYAPPSFRFHIIYYVPLQDSYYYCWRTVLGAKVKGRLQFLTYCTCKNVHRANHQSQRGKIFFLFYFSNWFSSIRWSDLLWFPGYLIHIIVKGLSIHWMHLEHKPDKIIVFDILDREEC